MFSALLTLAFTAAPAVQEPKAVPAPPPAQAEVEAALAIAAKKNQRVLLIWGGEW